MTSEIVYRNDMNDPQLDIILGINCLVEQYKLHIS